MSNIGKLFNSVILQRLIKFFDENNLIHENQIGFKSKSRPSDRIFILKSLIDKYNSKGKKLYCCFVDFKKAFDKVNHLKLLFKLRKTNIGSLLYNVIKDMYQKNDNNLQVKIGKFLSGKFPSEIGVRQGDSISPTLFNFYINEINNYIKPDETSPTLGSKTINLLLYADDLILTSTTIEGLQKAVDNLDKFCADWNMEINVTKTKSIIFNKGGRLIPENVQYSNSKIETCKSYKYLGILMQCSGKFSECFKNLHQRGMKAMFKLTKSFNGSSPSFNTCIHLFDHLIKPILTYGSDVWGYFLLQGNNGLDMEKLIKLDIEKCHQKFLRYSLGVDRKAPTIGIYGETGRYPIVIDMLCNSSHFVERLKKMPHDSLLYQSYKENISSVNKNSWFYNINKLTSTIKDGDEFNLKKLLINKFIHFWKSKLFDDAGKENGNKLRDYRTYKQNFKREKYLSTVSHKPYRSAMTKLRLSAHKLNIETGRYAKPCNRVSPELRICPFCSMDACEDEYHFMIFCPLYEVNRRK